LAGCQTNYLGNQIVQRTSTRVAFGTPADINSAGARDLIERMLKELSKENTPQKLLKQVNDGRGDKVGFEMFQNDEYRNTPFETILGQE